ncbi:MAG TPA: response regulator [Bacteroidota bacterium]|jgi:DNA-binding response OmpR family regulator|nr:response regulator [Bacteroidota bacterium]
MKKALVIDDDEMDLELLRFVLSKEGFTVIATADGPQGALLYRHHRPDIVFLDLGLPSMSGIEVLKDIRVYDTNAKVFLITGYGSADAATAARELGAVEFMEKNSDVDIMVGKIRAALHGLGLESIP